MPSTKQSKSDLIYHYTDANGLFGILGGNDERKPGKEIEFHATNILFLNDASEYKFFGEIVTKYIENNPKKFNQILNKNDKQNLKKLTRLYNNPHQQDIYVTCFSERKDNLSQWRGYCEKGGYNLGLNRVQLEQETKKIQDCHLGDIEYTNPRKPTPKLTSLIDNKYEEYLNTKNTHSCTDFCYELYWGLSIHDEVFFKSRAFSSEKEVRLSVFQDKPINFKITNQGIFKPYSSIILSKKCLKEIWLSPNTDNTLNKLGLEMFLQSKGFDHVEIKESEIPYRTV